MTTHTGKQPLRTMLMRTMVGAIFGAGSAALILLLLRGSGVDLRDPGVVLTLMAGLCYLLMGFIVAVGAMVPRTGALILNVEDEEELREERPTLAPGGVSSVLLGLFLLSLLAFHEAASIGRELVLAIAAAFLSGSVVFGVVSHKRSDELTRQISLEASALALQVIALVFGGWAALAWLGYVGWISPLAFLGSYALIHLAAVFAIITQRGMMMPR